MRFFFYGTLMADSGNAVAMRLHTLLRPGVPATARGRLFAIKDVRGWYPGLVPEPSGKKVQGFLHESTGRFAEEDLAAIDRYEDFDPRSPGQSEFIRRKIIVEAGSRRLLAHAYVLKAPPARNVVPVANGSFTDFLGQSDLRPYCE